MNTVSLAISVVSALVAVVSVVFSVVTYQKTVKHDRRQATLDAYNRLQEQAFDFLNMYSPADIRDICEDTRSQEYKTLSGYVARIEHFCAGVYKDVYDFDVFYTLAHGYFDGFLLKSRLEPILEKKNSGGGSNELFYPYIHFVWQDMKDRRKKEKKNEN